MPQHWVQALNDGIMAATAQSMKPPPVIVNTTPPGDDPSANTDLPADDGGQNRDVEVTTARRVTVQPQDAPPRSASPAPPSSPKRNNTKAAQT
jgi:hypothetical protein